MACKGCSVQIEKIGVMYLYTIGKKKNYLNLPASLMEGLLSYCKPQEFRIYSYFRFEFFGGCFKYLCLTSISLSLHQTMAKSFEVTELPGTWYTILLCLSSYSPA